MRAGLLSAARARVREELDARVARLLEARVDPLEARVDPLEARVDPLEARVQALERHRSPMLWNDVLDPVPPSLGTIVEAVRSAAASDEAFAAAIANAIGRFDGCAQGPLLAALDRDELDELLAADRLPVPPPEARERYFEGDDMAYWISGLGDRLLLEELGRLVERPLGGGTCLLDFGSSSGRVLRHFASAHPGMRLFGVDLGRHSVEWARQHLGTAVTIAQGTTLPHLPFADGTFDGIYAGSVFTHIADFEEAWLLELHRVLAPGGFALLTFHSDRTWNEMAADPAHYVRALIERGGYRLDPGGIEPVDSAALERPMPAGRVVLTQTALPVNNANVFHSERWIRERWGHVFELHSIISRAHAHYQDAAVLRRPS